MSRAAFYAAVRKDVALGSLEQKQVDGIEAMLAATEGLPITHRAYLMATSWHETAFTMQPITEYGGRKYFDKYDTGKLAKALGNTPEADADGFKYRGRGYVQLTGMANYDKASRNIGVDMVSNPDLALHPTIAAKVLVAGCTGGWFTGKQLSDYLPGDYHGARRVVNGTDQASTIANYARGFEAALMLMPDVVDHKPPYLAPQAKPEPKAEPQISPGSSPVLLPQPSLIARLIAWLFGKGA